MKAIKVLSLIVATLFISMGFLPMVSALGLPPIDELIMEEPEDEVLDVDQVEEGGDVKLFFRGDRVTPTRPMGNSSEEIAQCSGLLWRARLFGSQVGTWSIPIGQDVVASGTISASIWARSPAGAKNAGFRINMQRSGGNTQSYFTNRQDLSANPVKFTVDGTYNQQFNAGDTLDVNLIWFSDPMYFIGPSAGGEFLFGNARFDSHVKIQLNPYPLTILNITVPPNEINKQTMTVKAQFGDFLNGEPATFYYSLAITGAGQASPANLGPPKTSAGGNASTVSWVWDHKADNAKNGEYSVTVGVSYENNFTVMNTSMVKIKIPGGQSDEGGFLSEVGLDMNILIAIIAVVAVMAIIIVVLKKRKKRQSYDDDEDEDED